MGLRQVVVKFGEDVDGFIKLFLADAEAEEFKRESFLNLKVQFKVVLGVISIRQHVVHQVSIAAKDKQWNDLLKVFRLAQCLDQGSNLVLKPVVVLR